MDAPEERALDQAECSGCLSVLPWLCPQMSLSPGPLGAGAGPFPGEAPGLPPGTPL